MTREVYDPLDRLMGLVELWEAVQGDERHATLVDAAARRYAMRLRTWWLPLYGVPTRSQLRRGWYWTNRMEPRDRPRPVPARARVY